MNRAGVHQQLHTAFVIRLEKHLICSEIINWQTSTLTNSSYPRIPPFYACDKMQCLDKGIMLNDTLNYQSVTFRKSGAMCLKMDKEFEDFFFHCQKITNSNKSEMEKLLKPLQQHLWKQQLKKFIKIVSIFAAICSAIYYVDVLNWYFCAVGRIIMIKLLPIWNWKHLENAKCLIPKAEVKAKPFADSFRPFNVKDCRACEHFGNYSKVIKIKKYYSVNSFDLFFLPMNILKTF